jgi:D-cysteine desulfhydrase family pyridoxal phosphate-dependent enzyme
MSLDQVPRVRFAHLPTPIEAMPRLGSTLGRELWVKRDDQTGLAFGGNKVRKLEFLLAEAQANGARRLMTTGAVQSNQCRQTAAAAARFGFACTLVLRGEAPSRPEGNLLLDLLCGAEVQWSGARDPNAVLDSAFDQAWAAGERPFKIVYGASSPVGALGYVAAMREIADSELDFDRIVVASSSAGTQAGMIVGAELFGVRSRITGISVDHKRQDLQRDVAALANQTAQRLELEGGFAEAAVEVVDDFIGEGYAILGQREILATRQFARLEGLLLDPVYTARAAGGMMAMIADGRIGPGERVLFWHTGGGPGIFAYGDALLA